MIRQIVCCIVAVAMVVPALAYAGPMVFSVRPSTLVQSANFGFKHGNLTPYVGLDLVAIGVEGKYKEREQSGSTYWEDNLEASGSAVLIIPTFGARYALSDAELQPYLYGNFFKSFAFVSAELKMTESWGDQNSSHKEVEKYELGDTEEEFIEELLGVWGLDFGFGAEYPISEHFSIAGQYGLRLFFVGQDLEESRPGSSGQQQWREEWQEELSATIGLSHAEVALRFTF